MIWVSILILACFAWFLEEVWRAPTMDDDGRITGPSMRDEAHRS
jgi:hypothetical protein